MKTNRFGGKRERERETTFSSSEHTSTFPQTNKLVLEVRGREAEVGGSTRRGETDQDCTLERRKVNRTPNIFCALFWGGVCGYK